MKQIIITQPGTYSYTLSEEGSDLAVIGRFWLKGKDTFDLHISLIHAVPHTTTKISLKAVVEGRGEVNLHGTVIVQKSATQTNTFLEERVLLLSDQAKATAIPNLEILNHDVKCSHAATIGHLDEDQLFYLESRGLSKVRATHLLAQGFLRYNHSMDERFRILDQILPDTIRNNGDHFTGSAYVLDAEGKNIREIKFDINQPTELTPFIYNKPIINPDNPFLHPSAFQKDEKPRTGVRPLTLVTQARRKPIHLYEPDDAIICAVQNPQTGNWETRYFPHNCLEPAVWQEAMQLLNIQE